MQHIAVTVQLASEAAHFKSEMFCQPVCSVYFCRVSALFAFMLPKSFHPVELLGEDVGVGYRQPQNQAQGESLKETEEAAARADSHITLSFAFSLEVNLQPATS